MAAYKIRSATSQDLPILRQFEQGVVAAERPFDPYIKDDPVSYYDLDRMIDDPHVCVAVAENGSGLIGSGYARLTKSKPYISYADFGYIGFIYLLPEARGKGVAQAVLSYLEDWTKHNGAEAVELEVYEGNQRAIKAYKKAGYSASLVTMRKFLA